MSDCPPRAFVVEDIRHEIILHSYCGQCLKFGQWPTKRILIVEDDGHASFTGNKYGYCSAKCIEAMKVRILFELKADSS